MGLTPLAFNLPADDNLSISPTQQNPVSSKPPLSAVSAPDSLATGLTASQPSEAPEAATYQVPSAVVWALQFERLALGSSAGAPTAPTDAAGASGTSAPAAADGQGRLRRALKELGLDPKTIEEFLRIGRMLKGLDPAAYQSLVSNLENLASLFQAGSHAEGGTTATGVPSSPNAANPASTNGTTQIDVLALQFSATQIEVTSGQGKDRETLSASAETLNLSFAEWQGFMGPQPPGSPTTQVLAGTPGSAGSLPPAASS